MKNFAYFVLSVLLYLITIAGPFGIFFAVQYDSPGGGFLSVVITIPAAIFTLVSYRLSFNELEQLNG